MDSQSRSFLSSCPPTTAQTDQVLALLRSNGLPSDPPSFRSTIASLGADVARYDIEINRLVAERDAQQRYSDQLSSVFAPVRRLPTEILVEIFKLCFSTSILYCDGTQSIPMEVPVGLPHPMNLLQVCSSWYDTIMATPSLWADIEVDLHVIDDQRLRRLSRSLARSKKHPLTLCVSCQAANRGLDSLVCCADRWRIVDLYIESDERTRALFASNVRGTLPLLERLGLGGSGLEGLDAFVTAPKLTHVILSDLKTPLPKLPWNQFHEFTYYTSDPVPAGVDIVIHLLESMSRCSSQCHFSLYNLNISAFDLPVEGFSSLRVHSTIPVFRLSFLDDKGAHHSRPILGAIIGTLTLPCLQELLFFSSNPEDHPLFWPREDFLAFSSRSALRDTLTKLILYDTVITEDELVDCLSEMKVLLELFIQDVPGNSNRDQHVLITDTLLDRLTWQDDPSCLAPHLHCFAFSSLFVFGDDAFMKFAESRVVSGRAGDVPFTIQAFHATGDVEFAEAVTARMTVWKTQDIFHSSVPERETLRHKFSDIRLF
ncbi:hypothetical protein C8R45DRAFT_1000099 [Mycena sanguinolenta]|nr:hypothetical protein C8R45DRAFT_1000099 [Mycena sanguinolenta]